MLCLKKNINKTKPCDGRSNTSTAHAGVSRRVALVTVGGQLRFGDFL